MKLTDNRRFVLKFLESWKNKEGNVNSTADLLAWIENLNQKTFVRIEECNIQDSTFWFYDDYNGEVINRKRSFFSIKGIRRFEDDEFISEQPIIIQPEIGYVGIICKEINGVMNLLMQAKIEPGNVNSVQISPTIQATKSNFTRVHGGKLPNYFEYFENSGKFHVIYDQIQSEQATRFYKKRNRNMIVITNDDIEVYPNYKWMTLGQIKELMKIDNLINMDTRTVIAGLPLVTTKFAENELEYIETLFSDKSLFKSIFRSSEGNNIANIYHFMNNYKMLHEISDVLVPLNQLIDWKITDRGITCRRSASFMVRYYDISISGREVQNWIQPLFKAIGEAIFGLFTCVKDGSRKFLVTGVPEIGSFDKIEIGPTIQLEPNHNCYYDNVIEALFRKNVESKKGVIADVMLSEEGGRFYFEQNRNIILEIAEDDIEDLQDGYFWVDYSTLNYLMQVNNCLNIQLRNLLSLLEV